jgi:hypothetical protein
VSAFAQPRERCVQTLFSEREMNDGETDAATYLEELLHHAVAGAVLARRGIRQAQQESDRELLFLCESSLKAYDQRADAARQLLNAKGQHGAKPGEQVTSASFAPGDGASDKDVLPEGRRGRAGNWPAF